MVLAGTSAPAGWPTSAQTLDKLVDKAAAQESQGKQSKEAQESMRKLLAEQESLLERIALMEMGQQVIKGKTRTLPDEATFKTVKNEYDLVVVSNVSQTKFQEFIQDRENRGWVFVGTTPLVDPKQLVWVFRRPAQVAAATNTNSTINSAYSAAGAPKVTYYTPSGGSFIPKFEYAPDLPKADDVKAIEAEIKKLQDKLAELKKNSTAQTRTVMKSMSVAIDYAGLTEGGALAKLLTDLGEKKFGKGSIKIQDASGKLFVSGSKDVTDWVSALVKTLSEK